MAFCTSCGGQLADGAKFCTACGTAQAGSQAVVTAPTAAAAAPAPASGTDQAAPKKKGGILKIILIILGILFLIGVLAIGAVVWWVKKSFNVSQDGDKATISTPFGTVSTNNDASKVAEELGVEVYTDATPVKEGTVSGSFAGITVATAVFETSDSMDQVEEFYKTRFPKSTITNADENTRSMLFSNDKGLITILLKNDGGRTKIEISRVQGEKGNASGEGSGEGSSE